MSDDTILEYCTAIKGDITVMSYSQVLGVQLFNRTLGRSLTMHLLLIPVRTEENTIFLLY